MKQFLRLFAVVGVVLLTALISAGSCDNKDPDANKNTNNNNSGNSGGDGNGNGNTGGNTAATVKITFPDATFAKRSGVADIVLKASAFPATVAGAATVGMDTVNTAGNNKKAFTFEFEGATGGLTIVDNISKVGQTGVTMSLPPAAALAAADKDGVKVTTLTTAAGTTPAGMNIVGIFASQTAPADAAQTAADSIPFAFSAAANTQPILWCVSTYRGLLLLLLLLAH